MQKLSILRMNIKIGNGGRKMEIFTVIIWKSQKIPEIKKILFGFYRKLEMNEKRTSELL